jgi:hypothetical protein
MVRFSMIRCSGSSALITRRLAAALAAVIGCLLAGGSAAYATVAPALGTDGLGVSIVNRNGVAFSYGRTSTAAARYRQIAGKMVAIECGRVSTGLGGIMTSRLGHAVLRQAPRRRGLIASGYRRAADFCTLGLVKRGRRQRVQAIVPLTRAGALFLDQQTDVRTVLTIFFLPESFVQQNERQILINIHGIALPTESSPVPAGKAGLYINGHHLYIGVRDAAGVVLFVQADDPTVRTNLLRFVSSRTADAPYLGQTLKLS